MRTVPNELKAHLDARITTTCQCWRLTRTDGAVLGFTDHDETIRFDDTVFEAASGVAGSEAEAALGLAAGTQEVDGALSSLAISETDIALGRYDGASVESFLVNWQAVGERALLDVFELGEVKRAGSNFTAELRGIAAQLDRQRGRYYRRRCDALLGDRRCKVDLDRPRFRITAAVKSVDGGGAVTLGTDAGAEAAVFEHGRVNWTSGEAIGLSGDIAAFAELAGGDVRILLHGGPPVALTAGDRAILQAGCDKSYDTCRGLFANGPNFRGFPHLPGNDTAFGVAKRDGRHDGAPVAP